MKAYAGAGAMSKAADGIWSITVGPYPAGAYRLYVPGGWRKCHRPEECGVQ